MTRRSIVVAVLGVALLAGCNAADAPEEVPAEPGPSATPTPDPMSMSPSPSPSATEPTEPQAVPPLDELEVRTGGVGPLTVGVPPDSNPGAAMLEYDPDACAEVAEPGADLARWLVSAYPDGSDVSYTGDPVRPLFVDADEDGVYRIDVLGATPRTAEGVGIGTSEEELRATYPALMGPFEAAVSEVWWLEADDGTLVLETQGEDDGLREPGSGDTVILMRVLAPGYSPEFGTANSGDLAGTCL